MYKNELPPNKHLHTTVTEGELGSHPRRPSLSLHLLKSVCFIRRGASFDSAMSIPALFSNMLDVERHFL